MDWVKPPELPADFGPFERSYYEQIDIMPFQDFDADTQEDINVWCWSYTPPPKWRQFGACAMRSRAWVEWFLRRGRNPDRIEAREKISRAVRARVIAEHGMVCWLCKGAIESDLHLDHVIPWSKGGRDSASNLRPAHALCNIRRGNRDAEELHGLA